MAAPVFAQGSPVSPPLDRRNTDRIRQQDISQREWQLRNFGTQPSQPMDRRQLEALMTRTEEDFTRILTLHNEIARAITSDKEIDYRFVSEATGEIKKRAARVQSALVLHLTGNDGQVSEKLEVSDGPQMKDALVKLCKQIRNFVTNPMIENPNTVDAQQLTKARRDLESVIQLSGLIKKDADKLSKPRN
jgi:hypothetical protein